MTKDTFLDNLMPLQPTMQLVAERLLHSTVDAEDTVQEVFIELWEKREELRHVLNIEGYAMQTLKYRCISLLRKKNLVVTDDIESLGDISDEEAQAEADLIEERAAKLDRMMEQLPEKQRQVIQMRYLDQLSHEEMQKRLKMSSTHVYTTLSRAMSALKTLMKQ
jgi:RNA polymerase sigma-70 factor (ECF subfamily)